MPALDRLPRIDGDIARITLTQGKTAVIDAIDAEIAGALTWRSDRKYATFYALAHAAPRPNTQTIYLHQLIYGRPGSRIDHINGDGLDNRRANLRVAEHVDNMRNRPHLPSHNTSGYLGVVRHTKGRWVAGVRVNGRQIHIAYCATAEEAAIARDDWIRTNCPSAFWTFNVPRTGERGVERSAVPA